MKRLQTPVQVLDYIRNLNYLVCISYNMSALRRFVRDSSAFVSVRHERDVLSQCPKQRQSLPGNIKKLLLIPGEILLFRALANNMAPMTNADESSTNRLTLFWLNISLFVVSTLCPGRLYVPYHEVYTVNVLTRTQHEVVAVYDTNITMKAY